MPFAPLHEYEMPCAVCLRETERSPAFTMFGSYMCPLGFGADYTGGVMAERYPHAGRARLACVDRDAEVSGSKSDINGALYYVARLVNDGNDYPFGPNFKSQWTLSCAECSEIRCPPLALEDGAVRGNCSGAIGDACTYDSCELGFSISSSGSETRRCQLNGEWSGTSKTCIGT